MCTRERLSLCTSLCSMRLGSVQKADGATNGNWLVGGGGGGLKFIFSIIHQIRVTKSLSAPREIVLYAIPSVYSSFSLFFFFTFSLVKQNRRCFPRISLQHEYAYATKK